MLWRSAWADGTNRYLELAKRITQLSEDIEELRSEKAMILSRFDKTDDEGMKEVKKVGGIHGKLFAAVGTAGAKAAHPTPAGTSEKAAQAGL